MILMHILREEKFYFSCTFVGERYSIGEMHIPRGRRLCVNKKTLFCLSLFMFVFLFALWFIELYLVSMLCCSHCIVFVCWTYIHTSLYYYASLNACSDDYLLCYVIIVVIDDTRKNYNSILVHDGSS